MCYDYTPLTHTYFIGTIHIVILNRNSMTKYTFSGVIEKTDCIIVPMFEGKKALFFVDFDVYQKQIVQVWEDDFSGKKKELIMLYMPTDVGPTSRVVLVGLGEAKDLTVKTYKECIGTAVAHAQNKKYQNISLLLHKKVVDVFGAKAVGLHTTVASQIASYAYDEFKTDDDAKVSILKQVNIISDISMKRDIELGITEGLIISDGVNFARHLGNTPPTKMTPTYLARQVEKLAQENKKLKVTILSRAEMKKLGMGCLLGVARGSVEEPKFIIVEYWGTDKNKKPSVLVGKGITFDSGGLSLKSGDYMVDMKFDMLGAASVVGAIKTLAKLGVKKNIIALIPSAENMPGGDAYRPDDILVAMSGKTVEIKNTDAEGRLILADALCYAKKYDPKEVIDMATLTGACMGALGLERSGLFTPVDSLSDKLLVASDMIGEQLWRLPLGEEYSEALKSEIADIKNIGGVGGERYGTASTAGAFLQFFTDYDWAHIDLASAIFGNKGKPWVRAGANGFGVQTIVEYLR